MSAIRLSGALFFLIILLLPSLSICENEIAADTLKTVTALRINRPVNIDGILVEDAWKKARPARDFRQTEPDEGEPATDSTVVKILYDDEAVYFGFWCFDSEPDKIIKILTRRDRYTESDAVSIRIDSHHDHQTAYYFCINAAGVLRDIMIYNNEDMDELWDAVWEADSRITDWGWSAEFKIPYSALRFARQEEYLWGLNFTRYIPRKHENSRWQFTPSSESQGVSSYGHLAGIKGIEPPSRMETLPYMVSCNIREPESLGNPDGNEFISDLGLDFKYGISSAFTLDATVNPDFGQVESDETVLNLGTYETWYDEKRPFFLEGFEIFRTRYFTQFYSRRIGRPPTGDVDMAEYYIGFPRETSIIAALKFSGKTGGGTSIGLLNATTAEERTKYRLENDNNTYKAVVEPLASYSAVRIKQDVLGGSSYVGGLFTSVNQEDRTDAFTGAADWSIYFDNEVYNWGGYFTGTNNGPGTGGMAFATSLNKLSGKNIKGNIYFDYFDRKVDWNRLGYLSENGYFGGSGWIQLRSSKEFSIFRILELNFNGWYNEYLDGYKYSNGGNVNSSIGLTNNWWIWLGYDIDGSQYDIRETRGNGNWLAPEYTCYWIGGCTDRAKDFSVDIDYQYNGLLGGICHYYSLDFWYRPITNLEFYASNDFKTRRNADYWVGTGEDNLPVFGELDNEVYDLTIRSTYTFRRNLSLQLYTQFYISAGEYDRYKRMTGADNLEPVDTETYSVDFSRGDFNYKSLNVNLVLRWEYRPGSTVYVVWTQGRERYDNDWGNRNYAFDFSRDISDILDLPQTNTFLIKANYWWNI